MVRRGCETSTLRRRASTRGIGPRRQADRCFDLYGSLTPSPCEAHQLLLSYCAERQVENVFVLGPAVSQASCRAPCRHGALEPSADKTTGTQLACAENSSLAQPTLSATTSASSLQALYALLTSRCMPARTLFCQLARIRPIQTLSQPTVAARRSVHLSTPTMSAGSFAKSASLAAAGAEKLDVWSIFTYVASSRSL